MKQLVQAKGHRDNQFSQQDPCSAGEVLGPCELPQPDLLTVTCWLSRRGCMQPAQEEEEQSPDLAQVRGARGRWLQSEKVARELGVDGE